MRFATFNVHGFADAAGRSSTARVIALLRELDCDLVALNEVPTRSGSLGRVASALELHSAFASAGFLGNALLSRAAMKTAEHELPVADVELRSALVARVDTSIGPLRIAATHLDPHSEDVRLAQLAALEAHLDGDAVDLLAGDFNALSLSDYDEAALAQVAAMRRANSREAPRGELVQSMTRWRDARTLTALSSRVGPLATCWAGTRIDYVWLSAALAARVRVARYEVRDTGASDHAIVVVELDRAL
ncbi:MAG: endonuclease/exonuclease/phosphatase family protein [Polyangiaceae bacterium]